MTLRSWWNSFDTVQKLVLVIIPLGLIHHVDHVGRADHSSWPFRPELGPFTFTLFFYPILVAVLVTRNHWLRVVGLGIVCLATLFSHTLVEPPQQHLGQQPEHTGPVLHSRRQVHAQSAWSGVTNPGEGGGDLTVACAVPAAPTPMFEDHDPSRL